MPTKKIVDEHKDQMEKATGFLRSELRSIRTGRASAGLVENLTVDYYGSATPLKQIATIAVPEAAMIVIKPFDPASLKDIERAIRNSEVSLAPIADNKIIRINVPPLSEERRKQIVQQVKQMGEKVKVSVRNIRRDANKQLDEEQKKKVISEDDRDKAKKDIDNLTKEYVEKIDEVIKGKSEEIMVD
jgi:ribosome recycling factor